MPFTIFGALDQLDESRHRAELYRAWSTARGAGLAHAVALEAVGTLGSERSEELRRYLVVGTAHNKSIASLVKARPNLFEPLESAVLTAGDEGDRFGQSLELLADWYARDFKRMLRLRMLMGYPVFLGVLLAFVIPYPFLHRGWRPYMWALAIALSLFLFIGGVFLSIIGGIFAASPSITRARFARSLVTALEAGIPAGRAARLAVDASGSGELRHHLARRTERELNTTPLATLFAGCRAVPQALLSQMGVADATGDYVHTLKRYADALEPT